MFKSLFVAFALIAACTAATVEEEDGVLVLTDDNFDSVIAENDMILVEFYAPWCGHCKKLTPEYSAAAAKLKESETPIPLAKLDATEHKEVGGRFGIQGFPTLKWFRNGNPTEYDGGRTTDTIVSWVTKKSGPAAKTISTEDEATSFSDANKVAVFGVFADEGEEYKAFMKAAAGIDSVSFAVSTDAAVATKFSVTAPAVVLTKAFDEGRNDLTDGITADAIEEFVNANKMPLVIEFTQESAKDIFGGDLDIHHLVFVDKSADHFEPITTALKEAATAHKGKLLSVYVPSTEARVMGYFGFAESDLPTAVLVNMGAPSGMLKYKLEGEVTADALKAQADAFFAGKLKPFLKSADVPAEPMDGNVRVLVGKNFEEVALAEDKDVLVEFYAPWCGHCKSLAPKFEALGEEFSDVDSVIIAKVDATENEIDVEGVTVKGFPTLYFFPANGEPVAYNGARETEDLADFVKEHSKVPITAGDAEAAGHDGEEL